MQTNLTGKQINQFAKSRNDIPGYFGDRYFPFGYYGKTDKRVNGEFISKKYKAIAELVQESFVLTPEQWEAVLQEWELKETILS